MRKDSERPFPETPAAQLLRAVALEAVSDCDPERAMRRVVRAGPARLLLCGRAVPLQGKGRLIVLAYGKAAAAMFAGLRSRAAEAEGARRIAALVVGPRAARDAPRPAVVRASGGAHLSPRALRLSRATGDHPVPLAASFAAGRRALRLAGAAGPADDVVFLASGGGSALLAAPLGPIVGAAEKTAIHRALLHTGAPIAAINTVRKHLSAIKGGRLALAARRARSQSTLVLCDVEPDRYDEVASGPSLPDPTTLEDLIRVIDRYALAPALPPAVLEALRARRMPETPKPRDPAFRKARSEVILSNRDLRGAAVRAGLARGLPAEAAPADLAGPVEGATEQVGRAIEAAPGGTRLWVLGGEVLAVPLGPGRGGRALEFALRLALRMEGLPARPWAFLALGSDGVDGSSDAAGAYVDSGSLSAARAAGVDPVEFLRRSDSDGFFRRTGGRVVTGPTGTNVRDLYLLLTGVPPAPRGRAPR
jgi:glycerate 2-kinase